MTRLTVSTEPSEALYLSMTVAEGSGNHGLHFSLSQTMGSGLFILEVQRDGRKIKESFKIKDLLAAWVTALEVELDREAPREILTVPGNEVESGDYISTTVGTAVVTDVAVDPDSQDVTITYLNGDTEVCDVADHFQVERVIRHG